MAEQEKPGVTIRHNKKTIEEAVIAIVNRFEDATNITVQSVHYYRTDPDPKLLNDQGEPKVDITLNL